MQESEIDDTMAEFVINYDAGMPDLRPPPTISAPSELKKKKRKVTFGGMPLILRDNYAESLEVDVAAAETARQKHKRVLKVRKGSSKKKQKAATSIASAECTVTVTQQKAPLEYNSDTTTQFGSVNSTHTPPVVAENYHGFSDHEECEGPRPSVDLSRISFSEIIQEAVVAPVVPDYAQVQSVALKFSADKVSDAVQTGDVVSIDAAAGSGQIIKGYTSSRDRAAPVLEKTSSAEAVTNMLPVSDLAAVLQVPKELVETRALEPLVDGLYIWMTVCANVHTGDTTTCHVTLLRGLSAIASTIHSINGGLNTLYPKLLVPTDKKYFLVYFECPRERKNKIETIEVDYSNLTLATAFGPAKVANESGSWCDAVILSNNCALITRIKERPVPCIEAIGVDLSKLPVVLMSEPHAVLEQVVLPQHTGGDYSPHSVCRLSDGSALIVACVASARNSDTYWLQAVTGRVTLPGPIFFTSTSRPCSALIMSAKRTLPSCGACPLGDTGDALIAYNNHTGGLVGTTLLTACHAEPVVLSAKQAVGGLQLYTDPVSGIIHIAYHDPVRRKGMAYNVSATPIQCHSSMPWPVSCGHPEFALFVNEEISRVCLAMANGFWFPLDSKESSASVTKETLDAAPNIPLGIADRMSSSSGDCLVVIHTGVFFVGDAAQLQPGRAYYAYSDGAWGLEPSEIQLGVALTPDSLLVSISRVL